MEQQAKNSTTRLKICGLTRPDDVAFCVKAGVSYLGFNFFQGSKRYLSPSEAARLWLDAQDLARESLVRKPGEGPVLVGVFVEASSEEIVEAVRSFASLEVLQLQGSYHPTFMRLLKQELSRCLGRDILVWRVVHATGAQQMRDAAALAKGSDLVLFDSPVVPLGSVVAGGSGIRFDPSLLDCYTGELPYGVAGGLRAGELSAVLARQPALIDVCSGVEVSPGHKDSAKIEALMREIQEMQA